VLRNGKADVVARGLGGPHGVAFARDGALLVSDTDHGKVLRFWGGKVTTFARLDQPRGIDVAPDDTVYVVEAAAKRIGVFAADGTPRGRIGPTFYDPYAVAVAGESLWVVDTSVSGTVRRISRVR
jgi:sugar lactone lactonase YvrE